MNIPDEVAYELLRKIIGYNKLLVKIIAEKEMERQQVINHSFPVDIVRVWDGTSEEIFIQETEPNLTPSH